jgi:hypothetical protein
MKLRLKAKERKMAELHKLAAEFNAKYYALMAEASILRHEINKEYEDVYLHWLNTEGRKKFKIGDPIIVVRSHRKRTYASSYGSIIGLRGTLDKIISNAIIMKLKDGSTRAFSYAEIELDYNLYKEDFADLEENYKKNGIQNWLKK